MCKYTKVSTIEIRRDHYLEQLMWTPCQGHIKKTGVHIRETGSLKIRAL